MLNCPEWIMAALQKRFDDPDPFAEKNLDVQRDRKAGNEYLNQLKESLNAAQVELLNR